MRRVLVVVLMVVVLLALPLHAQEFEHHQPPPDVVPRFVVNGFNSYKSVGPEAALKAWTEFSALENSKESADQVSYLHQVQGLYGPFEGYDFISSRLLTPRTRIVYVVMNYERGPLFAKFVIYRAAQRWLLSGIDFNLREEMILPTAASQ
jgi:hypothetical protein